MPSLVYCGIFKSDKQLETTLSYVFITNFIIHFEVNCGVRSDLMNVSNAFVATAMVGVDLGCVRRTPSDPWRQCQLENFLPP
jgi:hypothetical protein